QDVEESTDAGGVHGVLRVHCDVLGVEVLLRKVAGKGGHDADREGDHPDHPGGRPAFTPAGHEVLTPQVEDHEDEEHLDTPEVEAVEEAADTRKVPPLGAKRRQHDATEHYPDQGRDGDHAEDIDPGTDVKGLAVWKEVLPGQSPLELTADGGRPAAGRLLADPAFHSFFSFSGDEVCPGKGRTSASAKRATMSPISRRFGQEMRMKPQCK